MLTSYTAYGLSPGTTYYYTVAAYNVAGTSPQSSYASATTAPGTPTGVTAAVTASSPSSSITVSWGSVQGAYDYVITRSSSASGSFTQIATTSSTTYTNDNLSPNTPYYYKVAARNSGGTSAESAYAYTTTAPGTPTGVNAAATSSSPASSITVSWNSVSGATGYYIYRSTSSSGPYTQIGTSATASYASTGLSAGTTYYYKVAAYNSSGTGLQSNYTSAATAPGTPTGVTAAATSSSSITVSWSPVTGATGYNVYRSTAAGGTYSQIATDITSTSYTNGNGLSANTAYYYKVAATNSGGTSAQSSYAAATTGLAAPTNVTATATSSSSITVSWTTVTGAAGYKIYRSMTFNGDYNEIGSASSTSTTFTNNTGLAANTIYYYRVAAYNSSGVTGAQSNNVYASTQPAEDWSGSGTFTDYRNGRTYQTVLIGGQRWMAENLNYNTGATNSWCYDNDDSNCDVYGRLYTWDAATDACPVGWHLPTNQEWNTLVNYVGGFSTAGTKLKTSDWGGTNDYGFSALPGGYRRSDGSFYDIGSWGRWWTFTENYASNAYYRYMSADDTYVGEGDDRIKDDSFSVRCVEY
jgi:uncharacterized protein (TIGR02145 family)